MSDASRSRGVVTVAPDLWPGGVGRPAPSLPVEVARELRILVCDLRLGPMEEKAHAGWLMHRGRAR